MNTYFLLNNLHFAFEVFGALAFLVVAWLALDAYLLRKNFFTASRFTGFFILVAWQVTHAFNIGSESLAYLGYIFYILGLFLVLLSFILEPGTVGRPKIEAVVFLPTIASVILYINAAIAILYSAITWLAFRRYQKELQTSLKYFWVGFLFLSLGATLSILIGTDLYGALWTFAHILEIAGFGFLIWWAWQYLRLRIREEMTLIFITASLIISIIVTLAFSMILVGQVENAAKINISTNAAVLDLYIDRLKEEALTKAKLISQTGDLENRLSENDFPGLETLASEYLEKEKLGFLIVLDKNGDVVLRAHALTQKEDNLINENAAGAALSGRDYVTVEGSAAEKFSIRAASPLRLNDEIIGAIVLGFRLDNALVDNLKKITRF